MISVIIVTLNAEKTLEETILSIAQQTYRNFEIVAVDGGSSDSTLEIFKKYKQIVGTLISEPDKGIYNAMNKGIRMAKGDILFFLNAQDTVFSPDVFLKVADAFEDTSHPLIVFGDVFFTNKTRIPPAMLLQEPDTLKSYQNAGYCDPAICHQALFYHREIFDAIGGYNEKFKIYADFDFNIRAFDYAQQRFTYLPVTISNFDLGGISTIVNEKYQDIQNIEHLGLCKKKKKLWAKRNRNYFLFSYASSELKGYYIQLCGIRLDWSCFIHYFALQKHCLPLCLKFNEELPGDIKLSGFLPLEGWGRWINGKNGEISFNLDKPNGQKIFNLSMMVYLLLINKITLTVLINGNKIGTKVFSNGEQTSTNNVRIDFFADSNFFKRGRNTLTFIIDGCVRPKDFQISGDDRLLGVGLQSLSISEQHISPIECNHWYSFSEMLNIPVMTNDFYQAETWGVWLKKESFIEIVSSQLASIKNALLVISYRILSPLPEKFCFSVYINDIKFISLDIECSHSNEETHFLRIPLKDFLRDSLSVKILFKTDNPVVLSKYFSTEDSRAIGIGFERMCLCSEDTEIPEIPEDKS